MNIEPGMLNVKRELLRPTIRHSKILAQYSIFPFLCALCALCGSNSRVGAQDKVPGVTQSSIGVTAKGTPIPVLLGEGDLDVQTTKTRLLLIGRDARAVERVAATMRWFHNSDEAKPLRERYTLSAVPDVYPDGRGAASDFPPKGNAYADGGDPEDAYLWRWIGMHAPDLVVTIGIGKWYSVGVPHSDLPQLRELDRVHPGAIFHEADIQSQLVKLSPSGVDPVPAISFAIPENESIHPELFATLDKSKFSGPSPARKELQQRLDRAPLQVAEQLAGVYGRDLGSIVYIPAVAAMGQVRLAALNKDEKRLAMVKELAAPYVSGEKPSKPNGDVAYAGHLIFAELADVSEGEQRKRYVELAQSAADAMLSEDGSPDLKRLSSSQMSDAVFMSGPILARVGRLTGEAKYFDAATAHVANMAKMDLRDDGLWRHSPLDEAAWGRGNGFPSLGLAMMLDDLPQDHPQRNEMLTLFRRHMNALAEHQDYTGAWHQVIDHEESYRELSCTCMITYAMARGVRSGWLGGRKFQPIIDRAWHAIRTRVAADGTLVDVCTGTGKQKNLRAYLDRPAILGRDARGGAMALLVATQLAPSVP